MTTRTYTSVLTDSSTTAGFRSWGSEFSANLQACNPSIFALTADTGQINWTTVNYPGLNADAGYEIYRLNDTLGVSAPVYFKLIYGVTNSQTGNPLPRIQVIIGTGSNGSGTITGQILGQFNTATGGNSANSWSTTTPYTSYICVRDGFVGWILKAGIFNNTYTANCMSAVFFTRSTDSTGAFTTTGWNVMISSNGAVAFGTLQKVTEFSVRTISPTIAAGSQAFTAVIGNVANSLTAGGNIQVYSNWQHFPTIAPSIGTCTYIMAEITSFTTFSTTLFGSTPHTYLATGITAGYAEPTSNTGYGMAILWE